MVADVVPARLDVWTPSSSRSGRALATGAATASTSRAMVMMRGVVEVMAGSVLAAGNRPLSTGNNAV